MRVLSQKKEVCDVLSPKVKGRIIFADDAKHQNLIHILGVYDTEEKTDSIYKSLMNSGKDNVAMPEM